MLFLSVFLCEVATQSDLDFRAELTLPQCGSVNGTAEPEVAPPSVFHGHNFIEVHKPSGRDTSTGEAG